MVENTRLPEIVGQVLSAVSFVHDYVEFHFDGKILRSIANPIAHVGGRDIVFPQSGSRDALCEFIGKSALNVFIQDGSSIEVRFPASEWIRVPLSKEFRLGPEAAHFVPGENQPIEVW